MTPRGRFPGRALLLAAGDGALAAGLFAATVILRREIHLPGAVGRIPVENVPLDPLWLAAVALVAVVALSLAVTRSEPLALVRERGGLLVSSLLSAGLLVVLFFAVGRTVPRTVLLLYIPVLFVGLEVWRGLAEMVAPIGIRPVLVLGAGRDAERAATALSTGEVTGHRLLEWRPDLSGGLAAGTVGGSTPVPAEALDVVFASERPEDRSLLVELIRESTIRRFDVWLLPGLTDILASRVVTRSLGDLPLVPVAARATTLPARILRRLIDLSLGLPLLLLALPVIGVVSAMVVLDSSGPAWIRQRRVGLGGRVFLLWKVRTMRADAENATGPTLASPDDARLTRVGRWLRKGRFDELPQLFHVVSGAMSLIGPRPERPEFVVEFDRDLPAYRLRHLLRPGLTGLAQVMGAYATKPDVKLRYDLGYLFHWTPLLDLIILIRTVSTVLRGGGV